MTEFIGKYIYAHPEHKTTCAVESGIQKTIEKVTSKHGKVIGDTSALRHFTIAFGCTGNTSVLEAAVKKTVSALLEKHGKKEFTMEVEQFMFCPGSAPIVAVTPKRDSVDWNFFTELQATMLMDSEVNAAHPEYTGVDKITDETKFPAGFVDLKKAIDGGATLEDAAHQWMWPHMSAFLLNDKEAIGSYGTLKRDALVEKYGWIESEPIHEVIPIRVIGASLRSSSGQKFRLEIDV